VNERNRGSKAQEPRSEIQVADEGSAATRSCSSKRSFGDRFENSGRSVKAAT
jgi:hypothetical protein